MEGSFVTPTTSDPVVRGRRDIHPQCAPTGLRVGLVHQKLYVVKGDVSWIEIPWRDELHTRSHNTEKIL